MSNGTDKCFNCRKTGHLSHECPVAKCARCSRAQHAVVKHPQAECPLRVQAPGDSRPTKKVKHIPRHLCCMDGCERTQAYPGCAHSGCNSRACGPEHLRQHVELVHSQGSLNGFFLTLAAALSPTASLASLNLDKVSTSMGFPCESVDIFADRDVDGATSLIVGYKELSRTVMNVLAELQPGHLGLAHSASTIAVAKRIISEAEERAERIDSSLATMGPMLGSTRIPDLVARVEEILAALPMDSPAAHLVMASNIKVALRKWREIEPLLHLKYADYEALIENLPNPATAAASSVTASSSSSSSRKLTDDK